MSESEEFRQLRKLFHSHVGHVVTKEGIRIYVVTKPWIYEVIKIPDENVKNNVEEFLLNPGLWDREEIKKIREPLSKIALTALKLMLENGGMPKSLFATIIKKFIERLEESIY